ncbi:hypothetical protein BHYA_0292g00030 [Botrytis hyacinthi]|uniref:Uncharacterized protein n=1 Tax=Botrytis hyacinthi TaxID=278943 RepID=A0A4Z1G6Z6_9HELO|nr:hypothetical protein BHYA_0292g00030 [Botrytis hyacinthi]
MATTGSTIMNSANTIPIPGRRSLNLPRASALSLLEQCEIVKYNQKKSLYLHIQDYRGSQNWNKLSVSDYVPLPNTHKFTTRMSLQDAAQRCKRAMIVLIGIHNERAVAHNRGIQAQQQNEDEEENAERAEWTRIIVAMKAKNARDAEESFQSRAGDRMWLMERR